MIERIASLISEFRAAALEVELVHAEYRPDNLFEIDAKFHCHKLLFRFTRDHLEEFLEIAPQTNPERFYYSTEIEVGMGWATVGEIYARGVPDPMTYVIGLLASHFNEIEDALLNDISRFDRARQAIVAELDAYLDPKKHN